METAAGFPALEQWRCVVGLEGYEVSSHGQVRSFRREPTGALLTLRPDRSGYLFVTMGERKRKRPVHHLVLEAFVEPRPGPRAESRHLDGHEDHNGAWNLLWGTRADNAADKRRHGTHNNTQRETCRRLGHPLVPPNLDPYHLERGRRACRACHWGATIASVGKRNGHEHDRDALAREFHAYLVDGGPDPRSRNLTGRRGR